MPGQSITTLKGYGLSGPAIDEIANYYFYVGDEASLEIPLSGITDGGGGSVSFEASSSNESVVSSPEVSYTYPASEGTLTLTPNTSAPGRSVVTLKLTNGNTVASAFGFNSSEVSFIVEVIDVVTALKKKVNNEIEVYPNPVDADKLIVNLSGLQGVRDVKIMNSVGEPVVHYAGEQLLSNEVIIDTNGWKPGLYLLNISGAGGKLIEKIIVH